jgi:hypothetical protein
MTTLRFVVDLAYDLTCYTLENFLRETPENFMSVFPPPTGNNNNKATAIDINLAMGNKKIYGAHFYDLVRSLILESLPT